MGPKDQVQAVFESICDNWERCRKARHSGHLKGTSGSHAFQMLLHDCGSWMDDKASIDDEKLPSIYLTMGSEDHQQHVKLTPWSYIVETMQPVYHQVTKYLFGVLPMKMAQPTSKIQKVCTPSFGVQDYNTAENGPVWILGTPLFYQYTVGYSLSGPAIDFSKKKCESCAADASSLLASQNDLHESRTAPGRRLRTMSGPPRVKYFD